MKTYCADCRHMKIELVPVGDDPFGLQCEDILCASPANVYEEDSPIRPIRRRHPPEELNPTNNCSLFEKRPPRRSFWRALLRRS